jgi:Domain of unknown function (DUF4330)
MAILDPQGRLFGKISLLDIGATLIILMVVAGIFLFPGTSGSLAQIGANTKPIDIDLIVRGLTVENPEAFIVDLQKQNKMKIVIRNQPHGEVTIKSVTSFDRTIAVPQPDGTVKALTDPRPEAKYTADMVITVSDNAQITDDGPVLSSSKVKIGTPIEVEGKTYRFNTSVIGVRY